MFPRLSLTSMVIGSALLVSSSPTTAAESAQFNYHLPQVGQESACDVHFDLKLSIEIRQAGKTVTDQRRGLSRDQERQITVLEVTGDRATKVRVCFSRAQETSAEGSTQGPKRSLPIEGKSYIVQRQGADLQITDGDGNKVPDEERSIVAASMDGVGHRNQFAYFLHGRTVEVGQSLKLPNEMAADLLGLRDAMGDVQNVELKLRGIHNEPDGRIADFATNVAFKRGSGQALKVQGDLQVDVDTCHVVAADFSGPVSARQEQAHGGDACELVTEGTLTASVRARDLK